jgi:hypothetical protein
MTLISPSQLAAMDFVRAQFVLEIQEPFDFDLERMLRLRRDLRVAAQLTLEGQEAYSVLFDPPLAKDPAALRRHQRPGPGFILQPQREACHFYDSGDCLALEVVFWGQALQHLKGFAQVLITLGASGLNRGEGRFELVEINARQADGAEQGLWAGGSLPSQFAPPVLSAAWWIDAQLPSGPLLKLHFMTPARLISQGRPLFRPSFSRLFPFILRRLSSMTHAHCQGLELFNDVRQAQEAAAQVVVISDALAWRDWRTLQAEGGALELGGVGGEVILQAESLGEMASLLHLGSLLNLGKGAAYGAGAYRFTAA